MPYYTYTDYISSRKAFYNFFKYIKFEKSENIKGLLCVYFQAANFKHFHHEEDKRIQSYMLIT